MNQQLPENKVAVWDLFVRLSHWMLAATFIVAYLSPAGRSVVHETAGYILLSLVVIRIFWGFVGSYHARLTNFVVSPNISFNYILAMLERKELRFLGHNPAGAAMIILLWALVVAACVTGWLLTWQHWRDHRPLQHLHSILADSIAVAATLHIVGAVYASYRHRENLIWSMVTGKKRH
jgi:cytochrome b